jgi:hypothetical protein
MILYYPVLQKWASSQRQSRRTLLQVCGFLAKHWFFFIFKKHKFFFKKSMLLFSARKRKGTEQSAGGKGIKMLKKDQSKK